MKVASPARPLRVLYLTGPMDRGGVETWVMNLLRHTDRQRLAIDVATTGAQNAVYDAEIVALGARLLRCPSPDRPWVFVPRFLRLLREYGPYDAIHSHLHHFSGLTMGVGRLAGVPVRAVTAHSDTSRLDRAVSPARRAYLGAMRGLINTQATDRLAVGPEAAAALYGHAWEAQGVRVARLGLDLSALRQEVDVAAVRAELALPAHEPVLINVARLAPAKNQAFLLDLFAAFLKRRGHGRLLLVGDGPLRSELETQARTLGITESVHFLGSRPDVPRLLGAADVFVFPSSFEGLSLAIVEAQVAGLPCVVAAHLTPGSRLNGAHYFTPRLEEGPQGWCDAVEAALAAGRAAADGGPFDIATNLRDLTQLYGRAR